MPLLPRLLDIAIFRGASRQGKVLLLECESNDALEVLGYPDNLKLCSSMTLFYIATEDKLFADVLEKFYGGKQDELTLNQIT